MKVDKITAVQLKEHLGVKSTKTLVLDCRPFLAFNNDRITGAVNVFIPSILKRRLAKNGYFNLESVLPPEARTRLRNGEYTNLVMYDAMDTSSNEQCGHSEVTILIQGLQRNSYSVKKTSILKGGFKRFKLDCPEMCTGLKQRPYSERLDCISTPFIKVPGRTVQSEPTQLLPYLFIGDEQMSTNKDLLQRLGITAILNVSTVRTSQDTDDFLYKVIPIHDNVTENISSWFAEALQFIDTVSRRDGKILVHCRAGISRSATICIAYLMYHNSLTLEQAFEYVRCRRSIISPNLNFMQQLCEFERVLVVKMRGLILPNVSSLSPLPCNKQTEQASPISPAYFKFNVCAVSQT